MNALLNLFAKYSGFGWVWEKTDGAKTYLAAAAGIFSGLAGLINEVLPPLSAHNFAGVFDVLKNLPQDPSWVLIVGGVGALGLRHAVDKSDKSVKQ